MPKKRFRMAPVLSALLIKRRSNLNLYPALLETVKIVTCEFR